MVYCSIMHYHHSKKYLSWYYFDYYFKWWFIFLKIKIYYPLANFKANLMIIFSLIYFDLCLNFHLGFFRKMKTFLRINQLDCGLLWTLSSLRIIYFLEVFNYFPLTFRICLENLSKFQPYSNYLNCFR